MERAILGSCLFWEDGKWADEMLKLLQPDDFALDAHRRIYLAIAEMRKEGLAVDHLLLIRRLGTAEMRWIGILPHTYIASLTEGLPRWKTPPAQYTAIVKEKANLRRIIGACDAAVERCVNSDSAAEIVTELGVALRGIKKK